MANEQNLKPAWQPGQSGNPAGMKPGTKHLSTLLKSALVKGVDVEVGKRTVTVNEAEVIKQLLRGVAKGSFFHIREVFDRVDGKATQPVQHSGAIANGDLSAYTEEELLARLAELESDDDSPE